ncbi:MAG: division plane positioning ATPase MipZ [Holosporales bacterium]|jgi:chromosome partitioning protein|nr:division plane positioning ATPase MipZ [Holosporales bacterium]
MAARIIVFGNQKGGTGKSTLAMHLTVSLLNQGYKVATIDVDARQGTFSRYIENRSKTKLISPEILVSTHTTLLGDVNDSKAVVEKNNKEKFEELMRTRREFDFIIIDTPGSDDYLSRLAHSYADVIITPMNESFIDLDLLVKVQDADSKTLKPSIYAESVWDQKKERVIRDKGVIDWIVLVNRMSSIGSNNRQELEKVLVALSKRIGFRLAKGFKERVIFRELFRTGLTILDKNSPLSQMSLSHIAARQELNELLHTLNITPKGKYPDESEDRVVVSA